MRDRRIVRYNVDFCFRHFQYMSGAVAVDLSDLSNMRARVIAEWTPDYAKHHVERVLGDCTGIRGGWTIHPPMELPNKANKDIHVYEFKIDSIIYINLRRIHEKK